MTVGGVSDPLLLQLLKDEEDQYAALSKNRKKKVKALLLDGTRLSVSKIKSSSEIQSAIKKSIPIVLAKPTKEEVHAITGAELSSEAMVIRAKGGWDFEITLINESASYKPCMIGGWIPGIGLGGVFGDDTVRRVTNVINAKNRTDVNEIGEFSEEEVTCHRKWTVFKPWIWGNQGQAIDIGFQYDLYYVESPKPARKYLTVRTVGRGATPGVLRADSLFHRGYYQNAVTVKIEDFPAGDWNGTPFKLEDLAPQTDNSGGQVQVTTGKQFIVGAALGGANTDTGIILGGSLGYQKSKTMQFPDFCISQDPNPDAAQWTFWMNAATGARLRRHHTASDIFFFRTIRELPELAKGWLMPYIESVYFADGTETGKRKMVGTVEQSLQDLKSFVLLKKKKDIHGVLSTDIMIDFSSVRPNCDKKDSEGEEVSCKKQD